MGDHDLESRTDQNEELQMIAASLDAEPSESEQNATAPSENPPAAEPEAADAPEPPAEPAHAQPEPAFLGAIDEAVSTGAPTWPFVIYEGIWAAFAAALVVMLRDAPEGPLYGEPLYAASVAAGLILTGFGPALIVVVWLLSGGTQKGRRASVFVSSLLKGAVATFLGAVLWIVALVVLDQLRLGSVL